MISKAMSYILRHGALKEGDPKGKRNKGERSMCCAIRELYEETSLTLNDITITNEIKEEINDRGNCPTVYFTGITQSKLPLQCLDIDEDLTVCWSDIETLKKSNLMQRRLQLLD